MGDTFAILRSALLVEVCHLSGKKLIFTVIFLSIFCHNMGKVKQAVPAEQRRTSPRLALKPRAAPVETKKKAAAKKAAPKAKKAKPAENGNTKAEEPKAEATEAK